MAELLIPGEIALSPERIMTAQGRWAVAEGMRRGRPLHEVAEPYLKGQSPQYRASVTEAHQFLTGHATPAFHAVTDPAVLVAMPVAAHQEYGHITTALEQYAAQREAPKHRIVLHCNWPQDANPKAVQQTLESIEQFQAKYPEVPLAYYVSPLEEDTPIATIRQHAWDVALHDQLASNRTDDIIMLNHDADIVKLNSLHLRNMHRQFTGRQNPTTMVIPRGRHERSGGRLANMDTVAAWHDFMPGITRGYYEMGCGISARAFMAAKGFTQTTRVAETITMIKRIHQGEAKDHAGQVFEPGAIVISSARRIYLKLYCSYSPHEFWHGDFRNTEGYRTWNTHKISDIPNAQRDEVLTDFLAGPNGLFRDYTEYLCERGLDVDASLARSLRVMQVGRASLGGPDLAAAYAKRADAIREQLTPIEEILL